jgi:hypothetical protein
VTGTWTSIDSSICDMGSTSRSVSCCAEGVPGALVT